MVLAYARYFHESKMATAARQNDWSATLEKWTSRIWERQDAPMSISSEQIYVVERRLCQGKSTICNYRLDYITILIVMATTTVELL